MKEHSAKPALKARAPDSISTDLAGRIARKIVSNGAQSNLPFESHDCSVTFKSRWRLVERIGKTIRAYHSRRPRYRLDEQAGIPCCADEPRK